MNPYKTTRINKILDESIPAELGAYVLDKDNKPVLAKTRREYIDLIDNADKRQVAVTKIESHDVTVSTVFLVINHNFVKGGKPILWETMVFGGKLEGYMDRYMSYEDAVKGHEEVVQKVKEAEGLVK
jgi:hypothetical protein